ncbi:phosphoglycerate mutase-like protein [Dendrothele bispora CBS 962.96]|uniref:Phosphoglycerate mutase-like protein n=1 Tax=Dendrothele bispora (strain CBS 962.96) TaxID=1314807 RepID=A0A4S8M3U3_DENBC|nr:phosphoglycerate mutase-like protein [Dendrothele bispora CBS 962.96]
MEPSPGTQKTHKTDSLVRYSVYKATFTLIRHGESKGNVRPVWAGQSNDELSDHGKKQAEALGKWFEEKGKEFEVIYVSDLSRAKQTADAIQQRHAGPKPPLKEDKDLREISFGDADGKPYVAEAEPGKTLKELYSQNIFPHIRDRIGRFPNGESKDDVARRAERVIQKLIIPIVKGEEECIKKKRDQGVSGSAPDARVAIVSHGVFLRELLYALHRRNGSLAEYKYLETTGWTEVKIQLKVPKTGTPKPESLPIILEVTAINQHEHLKELKR